VKVAAVGVGSFLLGATFGVIGVAAAFGHYLKRKGSGPRR
jgi:hypothetical protein